MELLPIPHLNCNAIWEGKGREKTNTPNPHKISCWKCWRTLFYLRKYLVDNECKTFSRSRRNTNTTISQSNVGSAYHPSNQSQPGCPPAPQNSLPNSSNHHPPAVGGKALDKGRPLSILGHFRWDRLANVHGDSGGVGLVPWSTGDNSDTQICLWYGQQ